MNQNKIGGRKETGFGYITKIEKAIDHFTGNSNLIQMDEIFQVAVEKFGFRGTAGQIEELLIKRREFALIHIRDPNSDEMIKFVRCD